MEREIIVTADGSHTIHLKDWDEHYHSKHGAIQEAYHVFIKNGLTLFKDRSISVLEIGFGTGLNALITFLEASKLNLKVHYVGVEKYPVSSGELETLNYVVELKEEGLAEIFEKIHKCSWQQDILISEAFLLHKLAQDFKALDFENSFDLIYFDAFGARVQPELWTEAVFSIMYRAMKSNGVLTTYAAKGSVRRAMQQVGFTVERLPGPPGKREMLRATK